MGGGGAVEQGIEARRLTLRTGEAPEGRKRGPEDAAGAEKGLRLGE
jgi:hypothetical protein